MQFIPHQEKLSFDEVNHSYFFKGTELTSVSKIIGCYKQQFDPDGSILAKKAAENGVTVEEQRAVWDKIRDNSCVIGTSFHNDVEQIGRAHV